MVAHRSRHDACAEAQASVERWSVEVADRRARPDGTVGEIGASEPLRGLPALAYPAVITVTRAGVPLGAGAVRRQPVQRSARARRPHGDRAGPRRGVRDPDRVGGRRGRRDASPRPRSAGQTIRTSEHAALLEKAVLAAFTTDHACRRKVNRPPGPGRSPSSPASPATRNRPGQVVSLADYQQLADAAAVATR